MTSFSLLFLIACAPKTQPIFPILVVVESDPGMPLKDAQLKRDATLLAQSDERGLIHIDLMGASGDTLALEVSCPEGYRTPSKPLNILLRAMDERRTRPEFHVSCPPTTRQIVVAVRTSDISDLPLRHLGQELARTDSFGVAHALLTLVPGEHHTLTIDTHSDPKLMPQHPELRFNVPDHDDFIVFDQTFTKPVEKARRIHHKERGPKPI